MPDHLSAEQVAHIADLARLSLSEQEVSQHAKELSAILAYVDQLRSVDTTGVEPVGQVTGLVNVLQDDEPAADSIQATDFLAAAPASLPPHLKVKVVLE